MTEPQRPAGAPRLSWAARASLFLGAILLALSVALGAAEAHALKARLSMYDPAGWFATARRLHELHALGLVAIAALLAQRPRSRWTLAAAALLVAGIVLFSGSLYLRSLFGIDALRAATPAGGLCFIAGWLALAIGALTRERVANGD